MHLVTEVQSSPQKDQSFHHYSGIAARIVLDKILALGSVQDLNTKLAVNGFK